MLDENIIKYRNLLNELHRINTKINRLDLEYKELDKFIEDNIAIDGKKPNQEQLSEIKSNIENLKNSLNNVLIKKVSKKI